MFGKYRALVSALPSRTVSRHSALRFLLNVVRRPHSGTDAVIDYIATTGGTAVRETLHDNAPMNFTARTVRVVMRYSALLRRLHTTWPRREPVHGALWLTTASFPVTATS